MNQVLNSESGDEVFKNLLAVKREISAEHDSVDSLIASLLIEQEDLPNRIGSTASFRADLTEKAS